MHRPSRRSMIEALLEREARQQPSAQAAGAGSAGDGDATTIAFPSPSRVNAVWRQKVIRWYFAVVAALRRQHAAAAAAVVVVAGPSAEGSSCVNPFDRAMVHVSASLLDNYLASLPTEKALRYKRDCAAYQLLATTCLLLGMRLARHDLFEDRAEEGGGGGGGGIQRGQPGLRRAKTHMTNMNEVPKTKTIATAVSKEPSVAIPTAATILRISAAPKSISERHVLAMVRELTGSRAFPRSRVVLALDYVRALSSSATRVASASYSADGGGHDDDDEDEDLPVSLGPDDAEEARRLADLALVGDAYLPPCRPGVLACAVVSLALSRSAFRTSSSTADVVRRCVRRSVFGPSGAEDPDLVRAARGIESNLRLLRATMTTTTTTVAPAAHLIPLEDD
ncbi:hypothetical protein ACHAW5_000513 [Stephanodiscus triporus]|uniref:Cyclin N-terminal domain-containing protein n=1 Tax=Stephanodiscus triporus TaxID=2934178 RepID=A0ABD3P4Y2_9STRA